MAFLEERLPICVRLGALYEDSYFIEVVMTAGGGRYPSLKNGKPYRTFDVGFLKPKTELALEVAGLYHRAFGQFAGFRVKCWDDFTTANDGVSAYSPQDCRLDIFSPGVYQLVKEYGRDKPGLPDLGRPRRILFKPVAGKVAIALHGSVITGYTVDVTTGRITLPENKSRTITSISQAASAVIGVGAGHPYLVGDSVAFKDVLGMNQINGLRGTVTATGASTITTSINSSAFSAYTSGGTVQTHPLNTGLDIITGGCEFDIPCAFDAAFSVTGLENGFREVGSQRLVEILNPLD
jgi:uncharacterized protein (TIGR02217 family)